MFLDPIHARSGLDSFPFQGQPELDDSGRRRSGYLFAFMLLMKTYMIDSDTFSRSSDAE